MMNVYQRLNAARTAFHKLPLKKTGENKFAKYFYFELGDFLIPALGVFAEHGLCATVSFKTDEATMTIRSVETPEDFILITSPMGSADLKGCHEVQNVGAVETYQRRYLWVAALEIVEHDALDSGQPKEERPAKGAVATKNSKQAQEERAVWLDATAMKLEACESVKELQDTWKLAYALMKSQDDKEAIATLEPIKDRMKALISEATA